MLSYNGGCSDVILPSRCERLMWTFWLWHVRLCARQGRISLGRVCRNVVESYMSMYRCLFLCRCCLRALRPLCTLVNVWCFGEHDVIMKCLLKFVRYEDVVWQFFGLCVIFISLFTWSLPPIWKLSIRDSFCRCLFPHENSILPNFQSGTRSTYRLLSLFNNREIHSKFSTGSGSQQSSRHTPFF